ETTFLYTVYGQRGRLAMHEQLGQRPASAEGYRPAQGIVDDRVRRHAQGVMDRGVNILWRARLVAGGFGMGIRCTVNLATPDAATGHQQAVTAGPVVAAVGGLMA